MHGAQATPSLSPSDGVTRGMSVLTRGMSVLTRVMSDRTLDRRRLRLRRGDGRTCVRVGAPDDTRAGRNVVNPDPSPDADSNDPWSSVLMLSVKSMVVAAVEAPVISNAMPRARSQRPPCTRLFCRSVGILLFRYFFGYLGTL